MAGDANYGDVVLLLHGDSTFVDTSQTPKTVTSVNAVISSAQSQFGGNSMYFDGTSDYLSVPTSTDFSFGSGDFTVEFWIYFNSVAAGQRVIGVDINTNGMSWCMYTNASGTLNYFLSTTGTSWNLASAVLMGSVATGSWYHVALCRSGGVFRPYINGVMGTTTASASALYASTYPLLIGAVASSSYVNGYIDDLRITKGVARYTATFTPHTAAHPDYAGQVSGIVRDSSNALCARTVRAYDRTSGALIGSTVSNAVTGAYDFNLQTINQVNIVCIDDVSGTTENDLILRTTPS